MTHGSLFSGIGGFDYAAQLMGWKNVFHCEYAKFPSQILKKHFPKSISYNDITTTSFSIHRRTIDVLSGGFPCQPYSIAGKRKGKEDDRHLWPEMLRAVREIQPTWVVGENVRGIIDWNNGLVFEEVQAQLEDEGYEVQSFILPSAGINTPHKRERVWFVAYSNSNRLQRGCYTEEQAISEQLPTTLHSRQIWEDWDNNLVKPYLLGANDGISRGLDRIKSLGNAIVPQLALQIFKTIEQYNNL